MSETTHRRRRCSGRATGRFGSRTELTVHIWAIRRQQLRPNLTAIAEACGASVDVVRVVLRNEEGLSTYLEHGLILGAPLRPAGHGTREFGRPEGRLNEVWPAL